MKSLIKKVVLGLIIVAFGFGCSEKSTVVPMSEVLHVKITNPRANQIYYVGQDIDIQTKSHNFSGHNPYLSGWGVGHVGDAALNGGDIGSYPYTWSFHPKEPGNYWVVVNIQWLSCDYWDRVVFTVEEE